MLAGGGTRERSAMCSRTSPTTSPARRSAPSAKPARGRRKAFVAKFRDEFDAPRRAESTRRRRCRRNTIAEELDRETRRSNPRSRDKRTGSPLAPAAIEVIVPMSTETAAPVPMVNVQIDGVWHAVPERHARDRGLRAGRQIHPALLLSPEALVARQLPHVPHRNGHAEDDAGSQAGHRRRMASRRSPGFRARRFPARRMSPKAWASAPTRRWCRNAARA